MGLLADRLGIKALSLEDPAQPLLPWSALTESLGIGKSEAGVMVNEKQAMRVTTAFGCINIISSDLSRLPFGVYQSMPDGSVREAKEHRLYPILHTAPNKMMTSMTWRGCMLTAALGWGNAYSLIRRDGANRVVSLTPLPSDRTHPALIAGELAYITTATNDGMPSRIDAEDMLHVKGLSQDGIVGLSPIGTCKNAFGVALAAEKFGAQFFGNGARTTGVFAHPGELDDEAYENLKKSLREMATGENALRPMLLEEGMTFTPNTIPPNEAQFLQTRQFQRSEIAALYRVAMHLLQDLQRATNNNIEHQSLDHLRFCLLPWAVRMEQEIDAKLLGGAYHSQHDFNEFQRGDFASQTAGFNTLRNIGVYSTNDILRRMHENPISAEEGGDVRIVGINMMPLERLLLPAETSAQAGSDNSGDAGDQLESFGDQHRTPIINSYRRLFRDAVGRIVNRKQHDERFAYRALHPLYTSMAESILASAHLSPKLTEDDDRAISEMVVTVSRCSVEWTKEASSRRAAAETEYAYTLLRQKLIGEQ